MSTRFEAEPCSQESSEHLHKTYQACCGIFPREAAALRRALDADQCGRRMHHARITNIPALSPDVLRAGGAANDAARGAVRLDVR